MEGVDSLYTEEPEEQQTEEQQQPFQLAVIATVEEDGLTLTPDGAEEPTEKHFKCNTGINFAGTGKLSTPLGAEVVKSKAVGSDTIIGLDRNYALEMVVAEDVSVDYDRLIDRQLERAAITSIAGFSKIFPEAVKLIKI